MSKSVPAPVSAVEREARESMLRAWRLLCLVIGTLIILLMRDLAVGGVVAIVGDHSGEWIDWLVDCISSK